MSNDIRKDNNRIQMQLVRLMQNALTWHDMEQIADAMAAVEIRHNSVFTEAGLLRGPESFEMDRLERERQLGVAKALGTYTDAVEAIRREHNGIFGIRLFYGHDGHNVCIFEDYSKELCRGESGRNMDEAVQRCIQVWNLQRKQEALVREGSDIQVAMNSGVQANYGPACAERTTVRCGGKVVDIVCGEPQSAHTPEAARADVGMDHNFVPGTWDAEAPRNQA